MTDHAGPVPRRDRSYGTDRVLWHDELIVRAVEGPRPEDLALAMVARFPAFRAPDRLALLRVAPTVAALRAMSHGDVELVIRRPLRRTPWLPARLLDAARWDVRWAANPERHLLWIGDAAYPHRLRRLYDPPGVLYAWGRPTAWAGSLPPVAMVGTRRPDESGRRAAFSCGEQTARRGFPVVSGLALGIDAAAHRGVVNGAAGGRAVAVLGSGIDTIYPRTNRDVAAGILDQGGAIVSEYPPGVPPARYHFPARNRIIAGLSEALVLFQAPETSGALSTAAFALQIGVTTVVHESGASWTGGRHLREAGAAVVHDAEDLVEMLRAENLLPTGWVPEAGANDDDGAFRRDQERKLQLFGPVDAPASVNAWRDALVQGSTQAGAASPRRRDRGPVHGAVTPGVYAHGARRTEPMEGIR